MDMYPAFLLLLLACSAQVTFGKAFDSYDSYGYTLSPPFVKRSAFDSYESFESYDPIPLDAFDTSAENGLGDPVHLVKRGASAGDCSAGCAPPTAPVWQNNVCKCLTPEQLQNVMDRTMDKIRKDFQKDPLLSGLVKRSVSPSDCSPGNGWECIGNVCKCYDEKRKRSASGGDSGENSLPSARDIIDSTMDEIRKDFEKNPLLSGLVKRNAASDSCSAESAGCAPGTEPASINNVCKCLTPEQLKNVMDSTMDKIRKDFEKNPLLSGLVKRSTSASECRAGCAPPTKEIWQSNEEGHVCKCLRPEQYLP